MKFKRGRKYYHLVQKMKAEEVKVEFENLEIHMGEFNDRKFKMKCNIEYEDHMLVMDGGKRIARLHARNISNVHLEKKAIRIAAMHFEIKEGEEASVATGSIRLELDDDTEAWYKELWG